MANLAQASRTFPADWKWVGMFGMPTIHQLEWRTWLAHAQHAEESALLRYWAQRADIHNKTEQQS